MPKAFAENQRKKVVNQNEEIKSQVHNIIAKPEPVSSGTEKAYLLQKGALSGQSR